MTNHNKETDAAPAQPVQPAADLEALRQIARELTHYNPAADEYKGKHIHGVWAREIVKAITPSDSTKETK